MVYPRQYCLQEYESEKHDGFEITYYCGHNVTIMTAIPDKLNSINYQACKVVVEGM